MLDILGIAEIRRSGEHIIQLKLGNLLCGKEVKKDREVMFFNK